MDITSIMTKTLENRVVAQTEDANFVILPRQTEVDDIIRYFYRTYRGEGRQKLSARITKLFTGISRDMIGRWINSNKEHGTKKPVFGSGRVFFRLFCRLFFGFNHKLWKKLCPCCLWTIQIYEFVNFSAFEIISVLFSDFNFWNLIFIFLFRWSFMWKTWSSDETVIRMMWDKFRLDCVKPDPL